MGKKKSYVASETHVLMPSYGEINGAENLSDQELAAYMQSDAMKKVRERYRIKEGYCVRELCGEGLVIPISRDTINENQMAILSPVGMFLWDRLEKGQTFGDLLTALLAEYDVSREEAVKDTKVYKSGEVKDMTAANNAAFSVWAWVGDNADNSYAYRRNSGTAGIHRLHLQLQDLYGYTGADTRDPLDVHQLNRDSRATVTKEKRERATD